MFSEDPKCVDRLHTRNTTDTDAPCSASIYADETCKVTGFWPYIFMIAYFILLKLILMTLLFALFASSASTLTADTDAIWKCQRYGLGLDFASRGPLPPPLNIFYYCYLLYKWFYNLCCKQSIKKPSFVGLKAFEVLFVFNSFFSKFNQKLTDFTLFILYSKSQPQTRPLADDEYNYFRLLASETFDELQNKKSAETLATLQWERIQALSEELEFQRQVLRQLKGKMSEMDRYIRLDQQKAKSEDKK